MKIGAKSQLVKRDDHDGCENDQQYLDQRWTQLTTLTVEVNDTNQLVNEKDQKHHGENLLEVSKHEEENTLIDGYCVHEPENFKDKYNLCLYFLFKKFSQ